MQILQTKIKAIAALVATWAASLVALYNVNQNLTLKEVIMAIVAGVFSGAVVHQSPKNRK